MRLVTSSGYTITFLHTFLSQGICDAIGDFVHLLIGERTINSYQGFVVGLCLSKVTNALMEEFKWCFACSSLTQA